jgi:hypothetical protein
MRDHTIELDVDGYAPAPDPTIVPPRWVALVEALMRRAAEVAVENGVDPEAFLRAAWVVYVDQRPDLREHIEEMQLKAQIDELRKHGQVGDA